jgi:tetratricopeptide (TPR) repeat protein
MKKIRKSKGDWRWLRNEYKISELAELLGVRRQTIDYWISGRNDPSFQNLRKLAKLVDSWEELERRAKVKLDFSPAESTKSYSSRGIFTARNYYDLIKASHFLRYIGQFGKLRAQAYAALKEVAGKDKFLTARLWFEIGYAELMLGYPLDAVEAARKARRLLPQKEDSMLLADTLWFSGECLRVVGKLNQAYSSLDEARKIYTRLKARPSFYESGPVWLEWDLGRYFAAYGRYDTALDHFKRMEKMAKNVRLSEAEVIAAWSRGDIAEMNSDFGKAIASYRYAKGLAELIGDSFWDAMALWRTAEVYRKLGQFEKSVATAETVRQNFEAIGNTRMVAKVDCVLAARCLQTGELDKAIDLYNNSIGVFTDSEDAPMERTILLGLGLIDLAYESQKPSPDYRKPFQSFLEIESNHPNISDPYLAAYNDLAYAEALRLAGYTEGALTRFDAVIKTSNSRGFQLEKAHALLGIAATKLLGGEADRQSCQEAFKIYQKVGSSWGQVQALIIQALIASETGDATAHWFQQAATLARENSLFVESQLIETLDTQDSRQKKRHVLLFLQAV